ncbi:MAG: hypothetical protein U9Q03_03580 [Patescibacteria group bacterium]|nr:hypothetical protein [Patescibacteria group bacterium]
MDESRLHAGPYIGVTGFTSHEQIGRLLRFVEDPTGYLLMAGLLVSHKTLKGLPAKFPKRYPPLERLNDVFVDDARVVNLAHFNSKTREGLADELATVHDLCTPLLHGFQLNMTWPLNEELERARAMCGKRFHYVIQLNRHVIAAADGDPKVIAERLRDSYDPEIATDTLIDSSGGLGKGFDSVFAHECIAAIREACPWTHVGLAGGIRPSDMCVRLGSFSKLRHRISIDAEGGLRDKNDELDEFQTIIYLSRGFGLFNQNSLR